MLADTADGEWFARLAQRVTEVLWSADGHAVPAT